MKKLKGENGSFLLLFFFFFFSGSEKNPPLNWVHRWKGELGVGGLVPDAPNLQQNLPSRQITPPLYLLVQICGKTRGQSAHHPHGPLQVNADGGRKGERISEQNYGKKL